jgi:hypothetical protein
MREDYRDLVRIQQSLGELTIRETGEVARIKKIVISKDDISFIVEKSSGAYKEVSFQEVQTDG